MDCERCGKCCFEPFYRHVSAADIEAWRQAGRLDIIEFFEQESDSSDRVNVPISTLGANFHTCKYLVPDGPGRFLCEIYEHRPETCRKFEPGVSRLCPLHD